MALFGAKTKRSFKNKTGGFFSQLMMERESMGEKMLGGTTTRIQKLSIWNITTMIPQKKFSVFFFIVVVVLLDLMASSYLGR
jgi:hypothetical protein